MTLLLVGQCGHDLPGLDLHRLTAPAFAGAFPQLNFPSVGLVDDVSSGLPVGRMN
jgi:hypothetical protein